MSIFKITKDKARKLPHNSNGFENEFQLRDFFAENLEELLGIKFIEKEYPITEGRIDTLGLDENNSPVIIEYKWGENEEVFAQGLFYYNWLISNKKHFELLVANKVGKDIKVNWGNPRLILVAQGFSKYIQGAAQQEDNIELISYNYYEPDTLHLESIYLPKSQKRKRAIAHAADQKYNIEYHIKTTSKEMQNKFKSIRDLITQLPEVGEKDELKSGITYKTTKSFVHFDFRPKWIHVLLRDPRYPNDTKKLVRDVTSNAWGYKGAIKFYESTDIDYLFKLIKSSYESTI